MAASDISVNNWDSQNNHSGVLLKFVLYKKWNLVVWSAFILEENRERDMETLLVCKMYNLSLEIGVSTKFQIFLAKLQS